MSPCAAAGYGFAAYPVLLMNIENLESFVKVVECRSMAEAARRLGLTPGAVAARIRSLEAELAAVLVQRSGHTVKPTEAGMRVFDKAKVLIQQSRDLRAVASTGLLAGELKVGVFPSALTTYLPVLMERFCRGYPTLPVYMRFGISADLCRYVHEGRLDAAIVIEPPFAIQKNCGWRTLHEETLTVIAHPDLAGREAHDLLSNEPFIRYDRASFSGKLVDRYLKDNHILPQQRLEVDSLLTIVALVERGLGVALVPDSLSIGAQANQIVRTSLPERTPIRRIGMIWGLQGPHTAIAEALVRHAEDAFT